MVFVHAFAGGIMANLASRNRPLTDKQKSIIYALGMVGGILPDIDLTFLLLKIAEEHRLLITHSAPIYTVAFLLWLLINKRDKFLQFCGAVFYLGVLSHLFLDFLTGGLVLLAPFTYTVYGIPLPIFHTRSEWANIYLRSPIYMISESIVLLAYLYLTKNAKGVVVKFLPWLFLSLAVLMVLILQFV